MSRSKPRFRMRYILAALALIVGAAMLASIRPGDGALYPVARGAPAITIYVIDNGFHTDLALPRNEIDALGGPTAKAAGSLRREPWIAVGWGDESFYTASGFSTARALDALRALFAPNNRSVIHIYGVGRRPDLAYGEKVATPVRLSRPGFRRMVARIDRSFALDGETPVVFGDLRSDEGFFRSVEHFNILRVCNHWTGEVLNAAGLPTIGWLHLTSTGLLLDLRWRAGVQTSTLPD